jgi:hypothetical protein
MKVEWLTVTIKCIFFNWNFLVWRQLSDTKKIIKIFTDLFIAEAWVATRISPSFSSSRQQWFLWFIFTIDHQRKQKKLTWIVRSQDLDSNSLMRGYNICGSLRINWIIRLNLTYCLYNMIIKRLVKVHKIYHITNTARLSFRSYF